MTKGEAARLFHDTYERLAPEYDYKTREASAVPWEDVPEHNRELMIATCAIVLDAFRADTLGLLERLAKTRREASWGGFPEDLMVHWTPETGFEYFSGTKGKLTREQARAEAEALLEGNGG